MSEATFEIPRGVEVLIKKASIDPAFKRKLIEARSGAAAIIALDLTPSERALIDNAAEDQLRAIINRTQVSPKLRPAFLGAAAATMLAALAAAGCKNPAPNDTPYPAPPTGINPDYPPTPETAETAAGDERSADVEGTAEEPVGESGSGTEGKGGMRPDYPGEDGG
ncbi:MAG: hypothetical protein PVH29_09055 [Candidatus Zixiibacteriota bacterium]|jgi:hypothetical protein